MVEHGPGGHFGGDPLLHASLFVPEAGDPLNQRAGARAGAASVLTGVAAATSVDEGRPVWISELSHRFGIAADPAPRRTARCGGALRLAARPCGCAVGG